MAGLKVWIQAFRLRTLPLAFSCILMGTFVAAEAGHFNAWILALCLLTTLFLQILSNLANDYGDSESGVDSNERVGPSRTVQSGLISPSAMKKAMMVTGLLAFLSGIMLIYEAFGSNWYYLLLFLLIGIGSIIAAIKYTVGANPYGYAGLGDLFVLLFFGLVGVLGSYFLYTNTLDPMVILPALSSGFLSVGVLNVNNIRDIESDRKHGKRSIPVRIGKKNAVIYHGLLLLGAGLCAVIFGVYNFDQWYSWSWLVVIILWFINLRAVHSKNGMQLDPYLRQLAVSTLLFVLLFGFGMIL
jgi:1,4-dihydroxy-2-naphthoate octaprenyltransferase